MGRSWAGRRRGPTGRGSVEASRRSGAGGGRTTSTTRLGWCWLGVRLGNWTLRTGLADHPPCHGAHAAHAAHAAHGQGHGPGFGGPGMRSRAGHRAVLRGSAGSGNGRSFIHRSGNMGERIAGVGGKSSRRLGELASAWRPGWIEAGRASLRGLLHRGGSAADSGPGAGLASPRRPPRPGPESPAGANPAGVGGLVPGRADRAWARVGRAVGGDRSGDDRRQESACAS